MFIYRQGQLPTAMPCCLNETCLRSIANHLNTTSTSESHAASVHNRDIHAMNIKYPIFPTAIPVPGYRNDSSHKP